ncbi:hypothetical protein V6N12_019886 [Hibiscus sabdariffa]|uniref:Myosin motor domain-containing protein n=1 Tax=Hibiscus sabdariffa TaxID=183260 RepID=A0ABR2AR10_9ROSI
MMEKYKGAAFGELSPHPFAIADAAYRQMIKEQISQAILVSGESGAGKTESTKMLMQYLAFMGGQEKNSEKRSVEQKVLESNPVLEAFGNAKTVRNNNSSRFGKFVEIQFNEKGRISGAAIRTYLLERSRVCQVSDPERNYHCFYMLCAAPSEVDASVMWNKIGICVNEWLRKNLAKSKGMAQHVGAHHGGMRREAEEAKRVVRETRVRVVRGISICEIPDLHCFALWYTMLG